MEVIIDDKTYKVNIVRKNNKNTYLRVKKDLEIYVTTNYFITNKKVEEFILKNAFSIKKMITHQENKVKKEESFYLLGEKYEIIICNSLKEPIIDENKLYINNKKNISKIYKTYIEKIFKERLDYCYNLFEESIPYPNLKYRKMSSKWGYCKKVDNIVMLNTELIKYSISEIDYVIIHELCHLLEFNHSKKFWYYVSKYKPDYKINKKMLKEN